MTLTHIRLEQDQDWTIIDGIFFAVVTICTVGYESIRTSCSNYSTFEVWHTNAFS